MTLSFYLFILALFIVFYTYIGYGILLWCLVKIKEMLKKPQQVDYGKELPDVTLFITAYNEENCVEAKMNNSLALNYPKEKLQILWVTDGSTNNTVTKLQTYKNIRITHQPERRGKTAALNRGMGEVSTSVTVFTDANTMINQDAIMLMVQQLSDPKVGCVAGEKRIVKQEKESATGGEGAYWHYESALKDLDSRLYSAVGAAGELFTIRTSLFEEMSSDTLLDDFILSMHIAQKGYRIAYCKDAYAIESASKNIQEEEKRKVRISAGGLQSVLRLKALLNPFRYGLLSFQYVSHRVLRWTITPLAFFLLIPLNILLIIQDTEPVFLYQTIAILQILFYLLSFIGWLYANQRVKYKIFFIPYYFLFMNLSVLKGFYYFWKQRGKPAIWEKAERS
ncbi:glycosyltransferase family 2 protein [Massilibacteroides sp.]|uniref:glycosyltransferase family 2 protein n=1 Tax=Massilibacteroides sp. TaxID=2034766 RepID=UPI002611095D|nr:glycosyltransferase family 2 protein [Massilibacteroides sp.]MDD4514753.1 glycosyltransferase family 2 protein [Massilibacteroides sp.]